MLSYVFDRQFPFPGAYQRAREQYS
jgi:hypothetical protein